MEIRIDGDFVAKAATETIKNSIEGAIADQWGVQNAIREAVGKAFEDADIPGKIGVMILSMLNDDIDRHIEDIVAEMLPALKSGTKLIAESMVVDTLLKVAAPSYESDEAMKARRKNLVEMVRERM